MHKQPIEFVHLLFLSVASFVPTAVRIPEGATVCHRPEDLPLHPGEAAVLLASIDISISPVTLELVARQTCMVDLPHWWLWGSHEARNPGCG